MRIFKILCGAIASLAATSAILGQEKPGAIAIFDATTPSESIRLQGVQTDRLPSGSLAIRNGVDDNWPGIHFEGHWDLSDYSALELTLASTSDEPIKLYCRLDCEGYDGATMEGTITRETTLNPGQTQTWRVDLPCFLNLEVREKLFAMRGKPGGIATNAYSVDAKFPFNKSKVVAIRPFENQNGRGDSWRLDKIVATPSEKGALDSKEYLKWNPDAFFPMIDQFGQFMHDDWPGKTHSLEELRAQIEIEDADLQARQPSAFDRFGGWLDGPQLEATGAFRTVKLDGVWHLVDPDGRLFWSNGIDCVGDWHCATPVTDREFYFCDAVPTSFDSASPLKQFLSRSWNSVNNYYAGRGEFLTYNFSASNLYLKYGDDWRRLSRERAARRLRSWGLNTYGNWSNVEYYQGAQTPYVATVGATGACPNIEGSAGYWGKFADPFDAKFSEAVRAALKRQTGSIAEDPFCIGCFVDNEISWGEAGSLARASLASPKGQAAKTAFIDWLRKKYDSIERFNAAWGVELESWDALDAAPFDAPDAKASAVADEDCRAFYSVLCEKYFSEIAAAMRELAPKKLYLGCRFAWTNDLARAAAQKYCDVVSYNFYRRDVGDFKPVEGVDKPVMIGEFHFGALDRGLFHEGLVPCKDQNERAQAYEAYLRSALGNPWIVGAHWFQYGDEATTGRFDGENYQIGFVDVCDRPYPETIEASRRVGYNMYEIRAKNAKR